MRFVFKKIIFFFLFINIVEASDNIRFIDINYIVNNSISGKDLTKIIEKKMKKFQVN